MAITTSPSPHKAILFLGATGGCGLSALTHSLQAGHTCIALLRTPSRLNSLLPLDLSTLPNLHLITGNARDADILAKALIVPGSKGQLVDMVITSIGGKPDFRRLTIDDPHVCQKGMEALLSALATVRTTYGLDAGKKIRLVALSSTGITDLGRDVPYLMYPLYHVLLKDPHKDKKALEELVKGSGERFTLVRPSLLTDAGEGAGQVRVGLEDVLAGKVESSAVGYTVSRQDVGKWIFEECIQEEGQGELWVGKAVTLSY
jgi:putative NADH-flavin reductase